MATSELIRQAGLVAVALLLLAVLTITVLRLMSLPLAGIALALDAAATGLTRALEAPIPAEPAMGGESR